jgi:hypothetical protein
MMVFEPKLNILPPAQLALWSELGATPDQFTLYGGTALALRIGHRASIDFDFFSNASVDPEKLAIEVPYLRDSERVQVSPNTLTCRVDRGEAVLVSFFGDLALGEVCPPETAKDIGLKVASLLDIAGTKVAVVQKRAETKDYLDIDALLQAGVGLEEMLGAGKKIYGRRFNALIALKAIGYFEDVPELPESSRRRLRHAATSVDLTRLSLS